MDDFPAFIDSLLTSVSSFLWSPSVRWVVMSVVLLGIIAAVRRLIRL